MPERRRRERARAGLRVGIHGGFGITLDVSASGVRLLADKPMAVGDAVDLWIDFESFQLPGALMRLSCTGKVVRVRELEGKHELSIDFLASRLENVQAEADGSPAAAPSPWRRQAS